MLWKLFRNWTKPVEEESSKASSVGDQTAIIAPPPAPPEQITALSPQETAVLSQDAKAVSTRAKPKQEDSGIYHHNFKTGKLKRLDSRD